MLCTIRNTSVHTTRAELTVKASEGRNERKACPSRKLSLVTVTVVTCRQAGRQASGQSPKAVAVESRPDLLTFNIIILCLFLLACCHVRLILGQRMESSSVPRTNRTVQYYCAIPTVQCYSEAVYVRVLRGRFWRSLVGPALSFRRRIRSKLD